MKEGAVISFVTPTGIELDGILFGTQKNAEVGFIFIHGLSSSAFGHHELLLPLAGKNTSVLFFNNRGHNKIGKVKRLVVSDKGYESLLLGEAHETFTDCVDDIDGAINFMRGQGVKYIYLVGHSTGCQKACYYLSQPDTKQKIVGVVLLCPLSDYAYAVANEKPEVIKKATETARKLVKDGKPHELLPESVWPDLVDAQRFLSLYTPDSDEEIFMYSQPDKKPEMYNRVTIPMLVMLAEKDEYADRNAEDIMKWFESQYRGHQQKTHIVKDALHNLSNQADEVATVIGEWSDVGMGRKHKNR